ncbi:unnamed protein product [Bemisia tabaci]|uniref:Uncharacterized protein n=1 Tax=Bemisia tabaci TaxID=7038 RepID=A0A9P0A532_BEMTA|nr:unnamed protein product [Bemisia tabaci]
MPEALTPCKFVLEWREKARRQVSDKLPPSLRQQQVRGYGRPWHIFYSVTDVEVVLPPDTPWDQEQRRMRLERWPIQEMWWEWVNWEGDIRPLPGFEHRMQELLDQQQDTKEDTLSEEEEEWDEEEEEFVEEEDPWEWEEPQEEINIVLPYPDDDSED